MCVCEDVCIAIEAISINEHENEQKSSKHKIKSNNTSKPKL